MKRSEVKLEIINILEKLNSNPEGNVAIAEEILSKLESAGMEPPAVKDPCETFVVYNGTQLKIEDSFIYTNRWENEA